MDKYTIGALKAMLCKELDEAVVRGIKTHEDLDIVKDVAETLKNLQKIEKNSMEQPEEARMYSQRGSNNYRMNYDYGNSYASYEDTPVRQVMRAPMMKGYSGNNSKEEIIQELHQMAETATDEKVKGTILECISKMKNMF